MQTWILACIERMVKGKLSQNASVTFELTVGLNRWQICINLGNETYASKYANVHIHLSLNNSHAPYCRQHL